MKATNQWPWNGLNFTTSPHLGGAEGAKDEAKKLSLTWTAWPHPSHHWAFQLWPPSALRVKQCFHSGRWSLKRPRGNCRNRTQSGVGREERFGCWCRRSWLCAFSRAVGVDNENLGAALLREDHGRFGVHRRPGRCRIRPLEVVAASRPRLPL